MSMPTGSPKGLAAEPSPQSAVHGAQHDAQNDNLTGVLRLWLSSIRPTYRRSVRGRSTLRAVAAPRMRKPLP